MCTFFGASPVYISPEVNLQKGQITMRRDWTSLTVCDGKGQIGEADVSRQGEKGAEAADAL